MRRTRRRFLQRQVLRGVVAVVRHPLIGLTAALALLAGCAVLAVSRLRISTESNQLFSPTVPFFRNYLEFDRQFPENDAAFVVIEARDPAHSPETHRWTMVADRIAAKLRNLPEAVSSVDERVPLDQLGRQGILFENPSALQNEIRQAKDLVQLARLWGESNPVTRLLGANPTARFLGGVGFSLATPGAVQFLQLVVKGWDAALDRPGEPLAVGAQVPDLRALGVNDPLALGYYYVPDQSAPSHYLLLIKVYERQDFSGLTAAARVVGAIRKSVDEALEGFPEFSAGLTGRPVLDADENEITDRDSRRAEAVALTAVFIGLSLMLRSLWLALAAEIALAIGIGWTFGYATLAVGRLNLLSTVFLIALIGIGMDYLVQILTRYRQEAARHARPEVIWTAVFRHVGAPITTACFGAAAAFFVSMLTDFRGAAELGIIAGGGLLLCLASGYTVLPALLTLLPSRPRDQDANRIANGEARPVSGLRRLLLPAVWVAALLVVVPFSSRTEFNPNLLDLQAPNLTSVKLVRKLQTWFAVVLSRDLAVLRAARQSLVGAATVAGTDSLLDAYDNYQTLQQNAAALQVNWTPPEPIQPGDLPAIARAATARAAQLDRLQNPPPEARVAAALLRNLADRLATASTGNGARELAARLSAWQEAFVAELQQLLGQFHSGPPNLATLPPQLKSHYVGRDGTFALYVNPAGNLWKQENLSRFETEIESRLAKVPGDPIVTGVTSDIYHSTRSIERSFYIATGYALAIIILLVLLDLRRLDQTLLAISVLGLGLPMLLGLMGWFGISWNFANFFGLPILIGAGHEYGVFMVHRYREACTDERRAWRWWDASDRALFLCAYVTSTSFGFFWALGHHRGLRSLGLVMALGTACIYLAAVLVVRPILRWRLERRAQCR